MTLVSVLRGVRFGPLSLYGQACKAVRKSHFVSSPISCQTPNNSVHFRAAPVRSLTFCGNVRTLRCLQLSRGRVLQRSSGLQLHTSAPLRALPTPLLLLVLKPLQKITAVILGRSIRKWWAALPANRRQLLREALWQRRWHLVTCAAVALTIVAVFLFTHINEAPMTGRLRLVVFSRESYMELADLTSEKHMASFEKLLIPENDPRHQVVHQVMQHLLQRNKDIPELSAVTWSVHVVQNPEINAFVLPNGQVFMFTGMLNAVADIHQLTFVLGHEMAHALLGHSAEKASLSHILDLLSLILLTAIWAVCPRDSLALLAHWTQDKLIELTFNRPNSRLLEAEADRVGLQLAAKVATWYTLSLLHPFCLVRMTIFHCCRGSLESSTLQWQHSQACADVRAGPVFWHQMEMRDQLNGHPKIPEWLSTHPSHKNRLTQLDRLIPQALQLRQSCLCPTLPPIDPRAVFLKSVQVLLEKTAAHGRIGPEGALKSLTYSSAPLPTGPTTALLDQPPQSPSSNTDMENKVRVLASQSVVATPVPGPAEGDELPHRVYGAS